METMFDKPRVFVGSATESIEVARAIQQQLTRCAWAERWPDRRVAGYPRSPWRPGRH
jgi:hypothetical protein